MVDPSFKGQRRESWCHKHTALFASKLGSSERSLIEIFVSLKLIFNDACSKENTQHLVNTKWTCSWKASMILKLKWNLFPLLTFSLSYDTYEIDIITQINFSIKDRENKNKLQTLFN